MRKEKDNGVYAAPDDAVIILTMDKRLLQSIVGL
jgi:hypothetical protein